MEKYNGHPFLLPKAGTNRMMDDFTDEELMKISPALTKKEKEAAHSEFFYQMPAHLPEYLEQALNCEMMNPSDAFELKDYLKAMNNMGHCKVENGCCVLPNGITYAAALIRQEGRSDEMIEFYNREFGVTDSLFYKTWFPGSHYLHYPDGAMEDFGFGRVKMKFMNQVTPEQLGTTIEEIQRNDPACIGIGGTSAIGYNLDSDEPLKAEWNTIMFYHRMTEFGREVRIRLWYGFGIDKDGFHITLPKKEEAEKIARCTLQHVAQEYTNDQYLQLKFWEKYHENNE